MSWHYLTFNGSNRYEINLNLTLNCGQSFRWVNVNNEWRCGFESLVVRLKQEIDGSVYFFSNEDERADMLKFLIEYFRCSESLSDLLNSWKLTDKRFDEIVKNYTGIRLLRQSPTENLFSFICSSNNNIGRISKLACLLASNYGTKQYVIEDNGDRTCYPSFPSIYNLCCENLEESLRKLGFGYRAKYIKNTAFMLQSIGGEIRLLELRNETYENAKKFLMSLSGVGSKVADCVLLGSLDHLDTVPIDVHMFNVAKTHYSQHLSSYIFAAKSLTNPVYLEIRKMFNEIWSPKSGWAQLVVFASDLKTSRFDSVTRKDKRRKQIQDQGDKKKLKH